MLEIEHPLSHNYDGTECSTVQQDFVCLFSMTCRTNYPLFLVAITQRLRFLTKVLNKSEVKISFHICSQDLRGGVSGRV